MAETTDKQNLAAELANARARMMGYTAAIRRDLDVGARLKSSVAKNTAAWFAGAAVLGLLLSKIPPLRRKVIVEVPSFRSAPVQKAGKMAAFFGILKFAADFAKPAIVLWAKRRFVSERPSPKSPRDERAE